MHHSSILSGMAGLLFLGLTAWLLTTAVWAEVGQAPSLLDSHADSVEHCLPRQNISCDESCTCYVCPNAMVVANCKNAGLSGVPTRLPGNTTVLLLKNNTISTIPPRGLAHLRHVQVLELSKNLLSNLTGVFQGLHKLMHLDLTSNRLRYHTEVFTDDVFHDNPNLLSLHLINNCITAQTSNLEYPGRALANLPLVNLTLDGLPNSTLGEGFDTLRHLKSIEMNGYAGYCNVGTLRNDTFLNTSKLERLEIVHCGVKRIEPDAFSPLRNLRYLDLSYNEDLGFKRLAQGTYGLVNSSLRELHINNIHRRFATCTYVMTCHLIYIQYIPLEKISLSENRISKLGPGVLQMIPKTVKKIVARNNIFTIGSYIDELHYLENVTVLDLSYTHFHDHSYNYVGSQNDNEDDMDQSCGYVLSYHNYALDSDNLKTITEGRFAVKSRYKEQTFSAVPDDKEMKPLDLQYAVNFTLPNKLSKLSFRWNRMYYDIPVVYVSARDLQNLDLSHNFFPEWLGPIYGVENLTRLNMSHTSVTKIGKDFFKYFSSLKFLDLSYNYLENLLSSHESFEVFGWLRNLRVLDLRGNGLCRIHNTAFEGLESLEELFLQKNKLIMETFQINLSSLKRLRVLDLRSNTFSKLDDTVCRALDQREVKARIKVDLAENPLTCSCKNLDFLVWMHARMVNNRSNVVFDKSGNYICLNPDGSVRVFDVRGRELNNIRTSCVNFELMTTVLVVAFLFLLTLIVGAILYRYRWRIRYAYYSGKETTRILPLYDFLFDAFVSYVEDDADFVKTLTETLEGRGVRLCIPDRDCSANQLEITAIVNAIQASRHVVCVLSRQYLQDYWHQYEMHMALQAGIHSGRDNVLMLLYDRNLRARSLPAEVLFCIRADSYLDYPQDQRCLTYFWDNLERALRPDEEQLLSA